MGRQARHSEEKLHMSRNIKSTRGLLDDNEEEEHALAQGLATRHSFTAGQAGHLKPPGSPHSRNSMPELKHGKFHPNFHAGSPANLHSPLSPLDAITQLMMVRISACISLEAVCLIDMIVWQWSVRPCLWTCA
jgi:hypothetical protein